nr:MAG TPA: hypothetical protein [Caudoviricetes sp.]
MEIMVKADMKKWAAFLDAMDDMQDVVSVWEDVHGKVGKVSKSPEEDLFFEMRRVVFAFEKAFPKEDKDNKARLRVCVSNVKDAISAIDEDGGTEEGFLFFTTRSLVRKLKELGLAD